MLAQYPALVHERGTGVPQRRTPGTTSSDRTSVEHALAYLGTLCDVAGQRADDAVLDTIAALLERAETAARMAATREAEAVRAEQRRLAAERRTLAAERRGETAERRLEALSRSTNNQPRSAPKKRPAPVPIYAYRDVAGICRVCGRKAPPQSATRHDDLRVCRAAECRQEAHRRDNVVKQRRTRELRRVHGGQTELNSSSSNA